MPAGVLDQEARVGAERRICIDCRAGKASIELCIGLGNIELLQNRLAVRPRQIENTIRKAPVLVFFHKTQCRVPCCTYAGDHIDHCRLSRIEHDAIPDCDNRIEHGAVAARERRRRPQCLRRGKGVSAADEPHAVGFVGNFSGARPVHCHEVKHPRYGLILGAWPAGTEDRPLRPEDLGLDKEVAERRVQRISGRRSENDFRVARHLELSFSAGTVGDADSAQLDIILRRDDDLGVHVDIIVAAAELCPAIGKDHLIELRLFQGRLKRVGPELRAFHIAHVAE